MTYVHQRLALPPAQAMTAAERLQITKLSHCDFTIMQARPLVPSSACPVPCLWWRCRLPVHSDLVGCLPWWPYQLPLYPAPSMTANLTCRRVSQSLPPPPPSWPGAPVTGSLQGPFRSPEERHQGGEGGMPGVAVRDRFAEPRSHACLVLVRCIGSQGCREGHKGQVWLRTSRRTQVRPRRPVSELIFNELEILHFRISSTPSRGFRI